MGYSSRIQDCSSYSGSVSKPLLPNTNTLLLHLSLAPSLLPPGTQPGFSCLSGQAGDTIPTDPRFSGVVHPPYAAALILERERPFPTPKLWERPCARPAVCHSGRDFFILCVFTIKLWAGVSIYTHSIRQCLLPSARPTISWNRLVRPDTLTAFTHGGY